MQKAPIFKDGVVLVAICLIVGGAVFAWWMQSPTHSLTATTGPAVQEPVSAPPPAPKPAVKPKPSPVPVAEPAPVIEAAPVVAAAAPVVQRDPLPFPVVSQIPTGVQEDSITDKYGDPSIFAVTSTGGHVVETIVYAKDRGHSATVIQLEDGKVATAYSQAERVTPPGLSAPRHWHNQ